MTEIAEIADLTLARLVEADVRVDTAEGEGLIARWEFGQELLSRVAPLQATVDELARVREKESTKALYNECFRRRKFAERFTEDELHHAVMKGWAWHYIVNEVLASTAHLSSAKDAWETPQDLFDVLDAEFHFTLDVCATADNAKCERFYSEASLELPWTGTCWMNPPYSEIDLWVKKAYESAEAGATVVCLVPSRTDVGWTWDWARLGEVRFLRGRVHFTDDEGNTGPAPFPSAVIVFPRSPSVVWWER